MRQASQRVLNVRQPAHGVESLGACVGVTGGWLKARSQVGSLRHSRQPYLPVSTRIFAQRDDFSPRDLLLPLPTTQEWGEDRREGRPLLSPALSSIRWRRGSVWLRLRRTVLYRRLPVGLTADGVRSSLFQQHEKDIARPVGPGNRLVHDAGVGAGATGVSGRECGA